MLRVLAAGLLAALSFGILGPASAQKSAFTADGERVYLYSNGTWSTDGDMSFTDLLELELQQQRQSASSEDRCTLIFGLRNGFAVDLKEVVVEFQFLDADERFIQSRCVGFKNPRSGKVRFSEVQLRLPEGCDGYEQFDVVDVPSCEMSDGTKIESCFNSLAIVQG